jgi:hypothetical protein
MAVTPMILGESVKPKLYLNVGCLQDIPAGSFMIGVKGETIINGGFTHCEGMLGGGNLFKSTIMYYRMLKAMDVIFEDVPTQASQYDTEINIQYDRIEHLASRFKHLPKPITYGDNRAIHITDKATIHANKWGESLMNYAEAKIKNKDDDIVYDGFIDPVTRKPLVLKLPTFSSIDSFTEFEAESGAEMLSGDLDSSDTNTHFMKQGLFKTKFLSQLPRLTTGANIYTWMVAHIGEKINMASGPAMYNQPPKELQHLKQGIKPKGTTGKFYYLTTSCWYAHGGSILKNQSTKLSEYPIDSNDINAEDLNTIKLTQLRSKTGPSGYTIEVVVSQSDGVLPDLTNFHFIKEAGRYGIAGSNIHFNLILRPEVLLQRTTVRRKLEEDELLARACELTANLLQLNIFHQQLAKEGLLCTPQELYDDIKKLGYDWNVLLNTRGYWKIKQYAKGKPFLSIVDLLKMRKGTYKPYFLDDNKKPLKEYYNEEPTNEK